MTQTLITRPAYRPYEAVVSRVIPLSTHFTRVVFASPDFEHFGTDRLDQRIKLVLPLPDIGLSDFGAGDPAVLDSGAWYDRWRALPDDVRNPIRTYTVRAVDQAAREVTVDFVTHADGGPAARWVDAAQPGDELVIVGPDARSADSSAGIDFKRGTARRVFLVGDETAAPAICSILEMLPADLDVTAIIEVPADDDAVQLDVPTTFDVRWLPRGDGSLGSRLAPALAEWIAANPAVVEAAAAPAAQEVDDDAEILWDSPQSHADFYAWIAGESRMVKTLRRLLVTQHGIDRGRVAFMGYWKLGASEN